MNNPTIYSEAFKKLEILVRQIEDEDIPLEMLAQKIQEATNLIAFCQNSLRTIEDDLNKVIVKE